MKRINTRFFSISVVLGTVFLLASCITQENTTNGFGVTSDVDPLKRVIILAPGEYGARQSYSHYVDEPLYGLIYDAGAVAQHGRMSEELEKRGIEVLDLKDLLADALRNAAAEGMLESALAEVFPQEAALLRNHIASLGPEDVLGRTEMAYYTYDEEGRFRSLIEPAFAFYYTRDFAVMTPRGLILTNARERWRKAEHRLGRFMFTYADALRQCPILFDAEKEGVFCEGGDIIVRDENTIFMGIHNFSEAEAAAKIARALEMDVIGVSMPPYDDFSGANVEIMHLDTVFNFVDEDKALTVPYLFEEAYAESSPLTGLLKSIQRSFEYQQEKLTAGGETQEGMEGEGSDRGSSPKAEMELSPDMSLAKAIKVIPAVGWLTRFRAGTGEKEDLGTKLSDYLRGKGYRIISVGGERGDMREDKYIMERVFYELSLQAANVVQLAPGKVLAYAHNTHTIAALRAAGVEVIAFEGKYLADGLGGPHCLTMPVLRRK